ncbi:MAG: beta-glucosidase, partial [Herbinix sp.]|nr:beta-glucosidase [Herbinix sp.]
MNYYDIAKSPLHPFGSGLCYTTFAYRDFYLQSNEFTAEELEGGITLRFTIKNTGKMDAFAVPQLYIRDVAASVVRRVRELKDFKKLWIGKGMEEVCEFTLHTHQLCVWNRDMKFVVEPGEFRLFISDQGVDLWETSVYLI